MRKTIITLVLFAISTFSFAQSWDYIRGITTCKTISGISSYYNNGEVFSDTTYRNQRVFIYDNVIGNYDNDKFVQSIILKPSFAVIENYRLGHNCFKAGSIMVGVGVPVMFVGALCVAGGNYGDNYAVMRAGYVLIGVGGTFVSFSIPLLCFGDHIKRECNMVIWR